MNKNTIESQKIETLNVYYKHLSLTGLALIWFFTNGIFQTGNKYLSFSFAITILGLILDYTIQAVDILFDLKIAILRKRTILICQYIIIILLFSTIGYYFFSSELLILPKNEAVGS